MVNIDEHDVLSGCEQGVLVTEQFDSIANKYGQEGWELVSCFDTNYA